jgi:hypothetical protein
LAAIRAEVSDLLTREIESLPSPRAPAAAIARRQRDARGAALDDGVCRHRSPD